MGMSRPSYGRPQSSFFGSGSMMQRPMPGGPGKGRPRGRFMRGGPGKGRGQGMPQSMFGMQQPMPARPSFGQLMTQGPMNMPRPTPRPVPFMGQTGQIGQVGNNPPAPPQLGNNPPQMQPMPARPSFEQLRPGGSGFSGPSVPDFGQRRTQGPNQYQSDMPQLNMLPMNFPQPTLRPDQAIDRPMPQPSGFDMESFGQMGPPSNLQFQQVGNNRPLPSFMGEVGQGRTQGPSSMLQSPFMMQQGGMGFYGGGITDLY